MVAHNNISRTSLEYRGSPGVTAGYVFDTTIEHNEVAHLPHSGLKTVSLGSLAAIQKGNQVLISLWNSLMFGRVPFVLPRTRRPLLTPSANAW